MPLPRQKGSRCYSRVMTSLIPMSRALFLDRSRGFREFDGRNPEATETNQACSFTVELLGESDSHHLALHRADCSQAQQIVVGRDQRKVHDLSCGGQKPIHGITVQQRELLGEQHDFVGERRFP